MNFSEPELENLLRQAPQPAPPASLKKQLRAEINLPIKAGGDASPLVALGWSAWLRRWWPALVPATCALACTAVMAVQRMEIRDLQSSMPGLNQPPAIENQANGPQSPKSHTVEKDPTAIDPEVARLTERAQQLKAEIAGLEQKRKDNEDLRQQLAAGAKVSAQEMAMVEEAVKARERAMRIQCINNLKQMGIAVRAYGIDNHNVFPSDYSSLSNEVVSLKVLMCPADTNRVAAGSWSAVSSANSSYDYLAPGGSDEEVQRVVMRCPIHGNFLLGDGSVQSLSPEKQAKMLKTRDGKLYVEP